MTFSFVSENGFSMASRPKHPFSRKPENCALWEDGKNEQETVISYIF